MPIVAKKHRHPDDQAALPRPDALGRRPARQTIEAMIAQDVFNARTRAGLTQAQLAHAAGIRVETLSRIENAKQVPDTRTLRRMCKVLGVDL